MDENNSEGYDIRPKRNIVAMIGVGITVFSLLLPLDAGSFDRNTNTSWFGIVMYLIKDFLDTQHYYAFGRIPVGFTIVIFIGILFFGIASIINLYTAIVKNKFSIKLAVTSVLSFVILIWFAGLFDYLGFGFPITFGGILFIIGHAIAVTAKIIENRDS